jgi:nuclear mRNA export protein SAC3
MKQSATNLSQWHVWLSTNPENDGTAIWLERKFDIPSSGRWVSDSVFSMSLSPADVSPPSTKSPGLIIFECTPLEGLNDELERKYRILDDCSRLREVILTLPADRHYIPSLLSIVWTKNQSGEVSSDFRDMVRDSVVLYDDILTWHVHTGDGFDPRKDFENILCSFSLVVRQ